MYLENTLIEYFLKGHLLASFTKIEFDIDYSYYVVNYSKSTVLIF